MNKNTRRQWPKWVKPHFENTDANKFSFFSAQSVWMELCRSVIPLYSMCTFVALWKIPHAALCSCCYFVMSHCLPFYLLFFAPPASTACCGLRYVLNQTRRRLESWENLFWPNWRMWLWSFEVWGNVLEQLFVPVIAKSRITNIRTSVTPTLKIKYWTMIIFELPLKASFLNENSLLIWLHEHGPLTGKATLLGYWKLREV